ncbi:MAG: AraC family transcriptional regulator, partial [Mesorhizobium sp.]
MNPDLEVVQIRQGESFKAWAHGYPFRTVRWHFHPEYELHLVV